MKIVMVVRDDYRKISGGDLIYNQIIAEYLKSYGYDIKILSSKELNQKVKADIVHLFQMYLIDSADSTWEWAKEQRVPLLISPLYEDPLPYWFYNSIRTNQLWKRISKLFGTLQTRRIYDLYHHKKLIISTEWKRQRRILASAYWVPNSFYELKHLQKWFRLRNQKYSVIPLGIDLNKFGGNSVNKYFSQWLISLGDIITQVSRVEPRKNQAALIEALANDSYPIVIVGKSNPNHPSYYDDVVELGEKRGNVYFIDYLDNINLLEIYKHSKVHVLPSWSERPGMVTLEAAACGCNVVSTVYSSIKEYLGDDAWYCYPECLDSILSSVKEAFDSPRNPYLPAKIREIFNARKTAERLISVYNQFV